MANTTAQISIETRDLCRKLNALRVLQGKEPATMDQLIMEGIQALLNQEKLQNGKPD